MDRSVRAVAAHARSYEDPIAFAAGDRVTVGRRDPDDPRWSWCLHPRTGRSGWVPETFLALAATGRSGTARCAYQAVELSVEAGDLLSAGETVSGWTWCATADGSAGWVPDAKLGAADRPSPGAPSG